MAHRSGGWCNSPPPSARGSFDLEQCSREPEYPLEAAVHHWLNNLKFVWSNWKRSETITRMLHEYFATAPNPYIAALDILVNCDDFRQAKPNSLAFTVMEEFSRWVGSRNRNLELQHFLTVQVKLSAFERMIKQRNVALIKLICDVYEMAEDKEIFIEELKCLIQDKQYKEACQIAAILKLHSHFTIEDFLVPLVFQDKLTVAEEFLGGSPSHQQDLVSYIDNLLAKRNIRNEADLIISKLEIPEVHREKLYYKPLSKLVARLTKQYELPPSICPNLNQKRSEGALQFLIHKRFQENSLGEESWREMAREAVGNNTRLHNELVSAVGMHDPKEAYFFVKEFNIPENKWPYSVENYFKCHVEGRSKEDSPCKVSQENWETDVILEYHTLNLSEDQVILVNSERLFQCFLQDIVGNATPMVGIDSEWKPYFGTKKNELALLQIATMYKVYILDVMVIGNTFQDLWERLGNELFGNKSILKVGFGLHSDMVMINHSLPFLGTVLQGTSSCLDVLLLWKKLVKDCAFVFPFSENTISSGESLTHLVELCLGRQLDKSDQFSNWERRPLRPTQIRYAALDAYCLLEVYNVIQQCCVEQDIPFDEVAQEVMATNKSPKKNHKKNVKSERPIENGPSPFPEPISPNQIRIVCDSTVEGLGKHLRICGVDTVFLRQNEYHDRCVRIANQQNRFIITKGRSMWKKLSQHVPLGHCYGVTSDRVEDQLKEVIQYFNIVLSKDDIFSRCKLCNGNEFARVSQATMKKLLASSQRMTERVVIDEDDSKWDGDGFSSESDACSDEGLTPPVCSYQDQLSEIVEGVDVNKCLTKKGVTIQVASIPIPRLEELSEFNICETCGKCYWDGTHLPRYMNSTLRNIV